jgi:hypothetical protein
LGFNFSPSPQRRGGLRGEVRIQKKGPSLLAGREGRGPKSDEDCGPIYTFNHLYKLIPQSLLFRREGESNPEIYAGPPLLLGGGIQEFD